MRRLAISALVTIGVACGSARSATQPLPKEIDDVRWNVSSTVFGDFTCRAQQDMALFGESEKAGFVVMLQPSHKGARPNYLIFATRGRDPKNVRFKVERLDFTNDEEFKREVKGAAPGLEPSKTCKGLALGDDETDANHIYWNRRKTAFEWWSL